MKLRFALIVLSFALVSCQKNRPSEVREFPQGFRGPFIIVWGEPGYPALPMSSGQYIVRIPSDGILITSTKQQFGFAKDEYYFVDASGKRLPQTPDTRNGFTSRIEENGPVMTYYEEFVGTEKELQAANTVSRDVFGIREPVWNLYQRLHPPSKGLIEPKNAEQ